MIEKNLDQEEEAVRTLALVALFTISCADAENRPDYFGTYATSWETEQAYCVDGLTIDLGDVEIFDYGFEDDSYDLYIYLTAYEVTIPCHFAEEQPNEGLAFDCTYGLFTATAVIAFKVEATILGKALSGNLSMLILNFSATPDEDYKPFCVTDLTFTGEKKE